MQEENNMISSQWFSPSPWVMNKPDTKVLAGGENGYEGKMRRERERESMC